MPPIGEDLKGPAVPEAERLPRPFQLPQSDDAVPTAPPDVDPFQRRRPLREVPFQRAQQGGIEPGEEVGGGRAARVAVEKSCDRGGVRLPDEVLADEPPLEG